MAQRSQRSDELSMTPDSTRDVIVEHVAGATASDDRWVIFVGTERRAELPDANRALVFARLLADLQQRPVWIRHEGATGLSPVDHRGLRGCSCC
jgi:hypothetical protein